MSASDVMTLLFTFQSCRMYMLGYPASDVTTALYVSVMSYVQLVKTTV